MISLNEALASFTNTQFPSGPESVPLEDAAGRFLYEAVASPQNVSGFNGGKPQLEAGTEFLSGALLGPAELSLLAAAGFSRVMVRSVCTVGIYAEKPRLKAAASAGIRRAGGWTENLDIQKQVEESPFPFSLCTTECSSGSALGGASIRADLPAPWEPLFKGLDLSPVDNAACYRHSDGRVIFTLPDSVLAWQVFVELIIRPLIYAMNGADYQPAFFTGTAGEDFPELSGPGCIPVVSTDGKSYRAAGLPEEFYNCLPPDSSGFLFVSAPGETAKAGDLVKVIPW